MKKLYELEMTRNNVTPRAFYGMVRRALLKKGGVELESWVGTDGFEQWKKPCNEVDAHSTENGTICKKPFDFQIAYKGTYNVILEFQFDDDNRGTGYAYICEYEAEEQPAAQEAANEPETETPEQAVTETETMEESNMKTYKVSFVVDGIAQGNMAVAESAEAVEAYYSREYSGRGEVCAVREAAEWEIEENRRRGMPFVKVPSAKPEEPDEQVVTETTDESTNATDTLGDNKTAAQEVEARNVFSYVCNAIKAADGDAEKLEALRVMVDSVARNGRLSPELRHIEIYLAYVFRHDEGVLEALDLYYDRGGAEETAQHFGWTDGAEAGQPAPQADMTNEERIDALFAELVPVEGKADTVAGEIVRAVCRIGYRYNNDGDYVGSGYGKETCNPAARYLIANAGENVAEIVRCLWKAGEECGVLDDGSYDDWLSELVKVTLAYLDERPELKTTPSAEDMWDYCDPVEDVDEWDEDDEDEWGAA